MTGPTAGVDKFIADFGSEGIAAQVVGQTVTYTIVPVVGKYSGQKLPTAVSVDELQAWPTVAPHWIHLPERVEFESTNTDRQNCDEGWVRHSREFSFEGTRPAIKEWLSHVQGFLSTAVA